MNIWTILIIIAVLCAAVLTAIIACAYQEGKSDYDDRMHDVYGGLYTYRTRRKVTKSKQKKSHA